MEMGSLLPTGTKPKRTWQKKYESSQTSRKGKHASSGSEKSRNTLPVRIKKEKVEKSEIDSSLAIKHKKDRRSKKAGTLLDKVSHQKIRASKQDATTSPRVKPKKVGKKNNSSLIRGVKKTKKSGAGAGSNTENRAVAKNMDDKGLKKRKRRIKTEGSETDGFNTPLGLKQQKAESFKINTMHQLGNGSTLPQGGIKRKIKVEPSSTKLKLIKSESVQPVNCPICGVRLSNKYSLERHDLLHQRDDAYRGPPRINRFACFACSLMFSSHEELDSHHRLYPDGKCTGTKVKSTKNKSSGGLRCTIRTCPERFPSDDLLRKHVRHTHGNRVYTCDVCERVCRDNFDLKRHQSKKHSVNRRTGEIEYPCTAPGCSQTCSTGAELAHHERIHSSTRVTKDAQHECEQCHRAFKNAESHKKHLKVHLYSGRSHKCVYCNKAYKYKGDVLRHQRTHTGDGLLKCRFCFKLCRDKGVLSKHERTHTKEKPYRCDVCEKGLGTSFSLQVHLKNMHGAVNSGKA